MAWNGSDLDEEWLDEEARSRRSGTSSLAESRSLEMGSDGGVPVGSIMIRSDIALGSLKEESDANLPWKKVALQDSMAPLAIEEMFRQHSNAAPHENGVQTGVPPSRNKFLKRMANDLPAPSSPPDGTAGYFAANTSGNDISVMPSLSEVLVTSNAGIAAKAQPPRASHMRLLQDTSSKEVTFQDENNVEYSPSIKSGASSISESVGGISNADISFIDNPTLETNRFHHPALYDPKQDPIFRRKLSSLLQTLDSSHGSDSNTAMPRFGQHATSPSQSPGQRRAMSSFFSSAINPQSSAVSKRMSSNPASGLARGESFHSDLSSDFSQNDGNDAKKYQSLTYTLSTSQQRPRTSPGNMKSSEVARNKEKRPASDSEADDVVSVNIEMEDYADVSNATSLRSPTRSIKGERSNVTDHMFSTPGRVKPRDLSSRSIEKFENKDRDGTAPMGTPGMKLWTPKDVGYLKSYNGMTFDDVRNCWINSHGDEVHLDIEANETQEDGSQLSNILRQIPESIVTSSPRSSTPTQPNVMPENHSGRDVRRIQISNSKLHSLSDLPRRGLPSGYESVNARSKQRLSRAMSDPHSVISVIAKTIPCERWRSTLQLHLPHCEVRDLIGLDTIMPDLQDVDLSHNHLVNVDGLPRQLNILKIAYNRLNSTASLHPFSTLQCLDISGNKVASVDALSCCLSLTELRADNTGISDATAIGSFKGLKLLSLKNNALEEVAWGFEKTANLRELNLSGNPIKAVPDLAPLKKLSILALENCKIETVTASSELAELQTLLLNHNNLVRFSVLPFPNIRTLFMDRNRLCHIDGISSLRRLGRFSARTQRGAMFRFDLDEFATTEDLYLAGNPVYSVRGLTPKVKLEFLELSACSITKLHFDTKSTAVWPTLMVLNLNHNGIKDIRPLKHLPNLRNLLLLGNRISDIAMIVKVAATLSNLQTLDLRYNPCTMKFYADSTPSEAHTYCLTAAAYELDPTWVHKDAVFRGYLDSLVSMERDAYRNSVLFVNASLVVLDSIRISPAQREQAGEVLKGFRQMNASASASSAMLAVTTAVGTTNRSKGQTRESALVENVMEVKPNSQIAAITDENVESDGKSRRIATASHPGKGKMDS